VTLQNNSKFVAHIKKHPYDIYVGRPSKWGNPFSHKDGTLAKLKVVTREEAIKRFEEFVLSNKGMVEAIKHELKGKVLGCWCSPSPCHAEVLARIANEEK